MSTSVGQIGSLLQGASGLISSLPTIMSLVDKAVYFAICLFLGSLVMHGWKRYKNWGINVIGSVFFGVLCLIGGVLLSQVIPAQLPFLEGLLQAFITAIVLYLILWLLSSDHARLGVVTPKDFLELKKAFERLSDEFKRLKKILERKKIMPEALSSKELEKTLREFLESKEIKEYKLVKRKKEGDIVNYTIKDKKSNEFLVSFDTYTGENVAFMQINLTFSQKIKAGFKKLAENEKALSGAIIAVTFAIVMLMLVNDTSIQKISEKLAFASLTVSGGGTGAGFSGYTINNTSCLTVTDALYVISQKAYSNIEQGVDAPSNILPSVSSLYPGETIMPGLKITYNGRNFLLLISTTLTGDEFNTALQNYVTSNPMSIIQGSFDFCAVSYNGQSFKELLHVCSANIDSGELCECKSLSEVSNYCFVFSNLIMEQFTSQLNQLGGAGDLLNILGS